VAILLAAERPDSPDFSQIVSDAIAAIFKAYPWVGGILIAGLAVYLIVCIVQAWRADEGTMFWGILRWKRDPQERKQLRADLESLIVTNRLLGLLLLIARSSLNRFDRILHPTKVATTRNDGLDYLCGWIARAFGFQLPDINKVTLFVPDGALATATELVVKAHSGISNESARALSLRIHDPRPSFAAMAFQAGEIFVCQDVGTDPRYHPLDEPPAHAYKSILAVPIMHGENVVGCFTIDSLVENRFGPDEESQGKLFAALFALFL
jgi:hypothetical protein